MGLGDGGLRGMVGRAGKAAMTNTERADLFLSALARLVQRKMWMPDGIEASIEPWYILGNITEELGEVATDLTRQRYYGAIAECVDVAHAALRLAITLDEDGAVLRRLFTR